MVYGGGGKPVVGAKVTEQRVLVRHHAVVVYGGVAHVNADGIDAVSLADLYQSGGGGIQGLIPADVLPVVFSGSISHSLAGLSQAVRVLVDVSQGDRFGADMAAAQGVVVIALDGQNLRSLGFDDEAANGFT